jgi:hypothetical protein
MIDRQLILLRIQIRSEEASFLCETEMEDARIGYSAAHDRSRALYAIRSNGNETAENRLARIRSDLEKHAHRTIIENITLARERLIAQSELDRVAILDAASTDEQLLAISSRYPA